MIRALTLILILGTLIPYAQARHHRQMANPRIEIQKIYRTNMTRNYARKVVTQSDVRVGLILRLDQAVLPAEHQPSSVIVEAPKTIELEVIDVTPEQVTIIARPGQEMPYHYEFDEHGKATPAEPFEHPLRLRSHHPIQVTIPAKGWKDLNRPDYGVDFQLTYVPAP